MHKHKGESFRYDHNGPRNDHTEWGNSFFFIIIFTYDKEGCAAKHNTIVQRSAPGIPSIP